MARPPADAAVRILVGTSGWSYPEWKGRFYPATLRPDGFLACYARTFPTVEVNNTFYRMPRPEVVEQWAAAVPDGFCFAIKLSRRITHQQKLEDVQDPLEYVLRGTAALGPKLGTLLAQLPPWFHRDLERLERFLALLPEGVRLALEVRHPSWIDDGVFELLRRHDAALCLSDEREDVEVPFVPTASFGYVRLREESYSDDQLAEWARRIAAAPWESAFVFFKHEDDAPALARQFAAVAGVPLG